MQYDYDIIIAGGGMVGASLTAALAPLNLRVAVIEAHAPSSDNQPSYDDRTTAISHGSRQIFSSMQVWPELERDAVPILEIHVSDKGRFAFTRITAQEQGIDALGFTIVNRVLGAGLWKFLKRTSTVDLICPAKVKAVTTNLDQAIATITRDDGNESQISARLLIAADGARSELRRLMGIGARDWDYGQTAIITNVTPARHHANVAFERFTDTGPLAVLPMSGQRCGIVWTVGTESAPALLDLDKNAFLAALNTQFGSRLGGFSEIGRRVSYPLTLTQSEEQVRPRFLVIGNAAHGLHPVAAQGFNLSLRDIAALAEVIADNIAGDFGSQAVLDRYQSWRHNDQRKVVAFSDGLVRLFTNPLRSARLLRNIGMLALDMLPAAKREFARHTMGRAGRQTRLARGLPLQ